MHLESSPEANKLQHELQLFIKFLHVMKKSGNVNGKKVFARTDGYQS